MALAIFTDSSNMAKSMLLKFFSFIFRSFTSSVSFVNGAVYVSSIIYFIMDYNSMILFGFSSDSLMKSTLFCYFVPLAASRISHKLGAKLDFFSTSSRFLISSEVSSLGLNF